MKVLITGADGFIGQNLRLRLSRRPNTEVVCFTHDQAVSSLRDMVRGVDVVFHLAGVNRPSDVAEFQRGNTDLTTALCTAIEQQASRGGNYTHVAFTSSTQAAQENPYGMSKRSAERALLKAQADGVLKATVFRLPNVFGKWARPNYNSAVATFCHNIARDLPIEVHRAESPLTLVYIDDVVDEFLGLLDGRAPRLDENGFAQVLPQYRTTVGEIANAIRGFRASRDDLSVGRVGAGLTRALYSTYVSYLPCEAFSYPVPVHGDSRGLFVEMLKTADSGQFSFFTAHPGITRGGHYHDSKTEKFLVLKGQAKFRFRHMSNGSSFEIITSSAHPEVVETVPGWTHDITNIGSDDLFVMLWANEVFDRSRPDTFSCPV